MQNIVEYVSTIEGIDKETILLTVAIAGVAHLVEKLLERNIELKIIHKDTNVTLTVC